MELSERPARQRDAAPPSTDGPVAAGRSPEIGEQTVVGELVIRTRRDPWLFVLALGGELDLASAPALEQLLDQAGEIRVDRVEVDLSGLRFSDSAGLHVLLNAHRRLRGNGQKLVLRRGPRAVQRLFELTRTDSIFRFED